MADSDKYPVHLGAISCLSAYGPSSIDSLRGYVLDTTQCNPSDFVVALADLVALEIITFDPVALPLHTPRNDVTYSLTSRGADLFEQLAALVPKTRNLSCGDIMLVIIKTCGMCTKQQLLRRLMFVSGDRYYSHLHCAVVLWALVRRERLQVRFYEAAPALWDLTQSGRSRAGILMRISTPVHNISMGE